MKFFILGGDGFVGYRLREMLVAQGHVVWVIDKKAERSTDGRTYRFVNLDLSKKDGLVSLSTYLATVQPDFVFNCTMIDNSDIASRRPMEVMEQNYVIQDKISDVLIGQSVKFIHVGSAEVYGVAQQCNEDSPLAIGPINSNRWIGAIAGVTTEAILMAKFNMHIANVCIVRMDNFIGHDLDWLPNIVGCKTPHVKPRLIPAIINSLLSDRTIQITETGEQRRCYGYIDDAIQALVAIPKNWDKCRGEIINVAAPSNEISINRLAEMMREYYRTLSGYEPKPIEYVAGTDHYGLSYRDTPGRILSIEKATHLLGWVPTMDVGAAVFKTVEQAVNTYPRYAR